MSICEYSQIYRECLEKNNWLGFLVWVHANRFWIQVPYIVNSWLMTYIDSSVNNIIKDNFFLSLDLYSSLNIKLLDVLLIIFSNFRCINYIL
jgi:hypothetical protein